MWQRGFFSSSCSTITHVGLKIMLYNTDINRITLKNIAVFKVLWRLSYNLCNLKAVSVTSNSISVKSIYNSVFCYLIPNSNNVTLYTRSFFSLKSLTSKNIKIKHSLFVSYLKAFSKNPLKSFLSFLITQCD